ncbi:pyridoxamine 5'-phosphate oxidase family protein [Phyllobacterium sp. SB3]|uniref:pyridoxamine 5'-phosphate oxidase family protein n=1 Tax=Phyllobacterium sp. SB3 TaxID=3156073 RepID=UPI0032AFBC53
MQINAMNQFEIMHLVEHARIGRLACVNDGQPYVIPMNFVCRVGYLYSFTTFGKKIVAMRSNPKVCVEFDDIVATNKWQSVVVTGHYEELSDKPDHVDARNEAHALLSNRAEWWEPAYVKTVIRDHVRTMEPVYFRILIKEMTGHKTVSA